MKHPEQYVKVVTDFLDRLIQEHGDRLFVIFAFACLAMIAWILIRGLNRPPPGYSIVILPLGHPPRDPDLPDPFEDPPQP